MSKIQTVLGTINANELGKTLTHEHFSLDFSTFYSAPPYQLDEYFTGGRITLGNVGFVKQYPYASKYNLAFGDQDSADAVLNDVMLYKKFGGGAIVENTTHGLKRDLQLSYEISKKTGVHVVAGTGFYVADVQDASMLAYTTEQMVDLMTKEILFGVELPFGKVNVKCGVIGEVGSGWPLQEFEKRAIIATAEVQSQIGCGVTFHPGRNRLAPFEIVRIYLEAGGKADKCVMSHLERTLTDEATLLDYSDLGTYCQFDLFGSECSYYQLNPQVNMPSDAQRIDYVMALLGHGKSDRVLLSHDVHTKHRLIDFGGHGYSHILNNILPRLASRDVSETDLENIAVNNPKNWLKFDI